MVHPYNIILLSYKKEWSIDKCYNVDEPWSTDKCYNVDEPAWKKPDTECHIVWSHVYEKSGIDKPIVVARGWGRRQWWVTG